MLRFALLSSQSAIFSPELREIHRKTDWSPPSRAAYLVLDRSAEAAFIGLDLIPDFVLYLIFVLPEHQHRGIGSAAVDFVRSVGRSRGECRVLARPRSLSDPPRDVESFYRKRGFLPISDASGLWECAIR